MPCMYCNSQLPPDENGVCPDCGRVVPQSYSTQGPSAQPAVNNAPSAASAAQPAPSAVQPDVNSQSCYGVQLWRCTWLILFFNLINAALMACVFAGILFGLEYYDGLDTHPNEYLAKWNALLWVVAMSFPAFLFLIEFCSFLYKWFFKTYELHPKDIRLITGFLNRRTNSTLLEALWGMKLRQNFFDRIFGIGKITVFSFDVTAPIFHIDDIGNVRNRFEELIRYQSYALDCSNVKVETDPVKDTSVQVWRYSARDLIDEFLWGVLITLILVVVGYFVPWGNVYLRTAIFGVFPVIYWCWLIWMFIDKIWCTRYILNTASLIKESGIFHKKIDVYVLFHIKDCEMSQNLWQRIIGDVGNITLYIKWENKEVGPEVDNSSVATTRKDVLHGLVDHIQKYETFKERWLRERHRRGTS